MQRSLGRFTTLKDVSNTAGKDVIEAKLYMIVAGYCYLQALEDQSAISQ